MTPGERKRRTFVQGLWCVTDRDKRKLVEVGEILRNNGCH